MLKKVNRLAKAAEIKKVFGRGRTFFNPFVSVKFLRGAGTRITVVVSTKVFKQAVKRNRLKRILREHLRKNLAALPAGSYVVAAKPKVSGLSEQQTFKNFLDVLEKLK